MTSSTETQGSLSAGSFVEVSYTARLEENGQVIDTTDPGVAEEAAIANLAAAGPVTVVIGADHLFEPVERAIADTGPGGSSTVTVPPEDGFGTPEPQAKATADLDHFPVEQRSVGERVRFKGEDGFIESIDDGTAVINFNHPLAGSTIEYEFTVHRHVDDPTEQVEGLLDLYGVRSGSSVSLSETEDGSVLEWSVDDPIDREDDWATTKRDVLEDVRRHLGIDEVVVIERHRRGRS